MNYNTLFSIPDIQEIADKLGFSDLLDCGANDLSEDISRRLKHIIQMAVTIMQKSKRSKLNCTDIIGAMALANKDEHFQFICMEALPHPLKFENNYDSDIEVCVTEAYMKKHKPPEVIKKNIPIVPEIIVIDDDDDDDDDNDEQNKGIEDVPPPENPPSYKKYDMKMYETVQIKQFDNHSLSAEQQYFYMALTEACVGSDESKRNEALRTIAYDQSIGQYMTALTAFIFEGVRVNVVQCNLTLSIYLMRMLRAMLDNPLVQIKKYLHQLIPAVVSCMVAKQLCLRPDLENHWALRDYSAKLIHDICRKHSNGTNKIQLRLLKMFVLKITNCQMVPIYTLYGVLVGVVQFGLLAIRQFILPNIKVLGKKLENNLNRISTMDDNLIGSINIRDLLVKILAPVVKSMRKPPDCLDAYEADYGFLGHYLIKAVVPLRSAPPSYVCTN